MPLFMLSWFFWHLAINVNRAEGTSLSHHERKIGTRPLYASLGRFVRAAFAQTRRHFG